MLSWSKIIFNSVISSFSKWIFIKRDVGVGIIVSGVGSGAGSVGRFGSLV